MSVGNGAEPASSGRDEETVKLALAISLLRSKILQRNPSFPNNPSDSDALRWKRKAKERKQELLRLREDLKQAEDVSQCDLFPQTAVCKCYFFHHLGKLSPKSVTDGSDQRFNDVLRRRFLRHVRFKERKRKSGGSVRQQRLLSDLSNEDEVEQLRASVDFLVELCDAVSPVEEVTFGNWSHQAVDFILASLTNLLSTSKNMEVVDGIISSLITRLVRRMCLSFQENGSNHNITDPQFYIQHIIRKLGIEAFIGQRAILSVSQRISVLAERLLFVDPFDVAFPRMHECMYTIKELWPGCGEALLRHLIFILHEIFLNLFRSNLIQLIEFLISDYLSIWSKDEGFDKMLFEEWVTSIFHARKALELLESRNGLYVLYMDRVSGELGKLVSQNLSLQKLKPDILDKLLC